jgi:formylglycine-generating enzyme required for sulfatase activity
MPSELPTPPESNNLIIRPSSDLVKLPDGGSPALSEIVSRSLFHIQRSRAPVVTERRAGEEREFEIAPGVSIVMCWVPPGEFLMGSPDGEENHYAGEKQHRVRITKGFWLAKTLTTQSVWFEMMGDNPSRIKGDDLPVENVSWHDICGDQSGHGGFLNGINLLDFIYRTEEDEMRFRLPTEAQWEYACRAGTTGPHYYAHLDDIAWYARNSQNQFNSVGRKLPNEWGLYDMIGNVWEWCSDSYGDYPSETMTDPIGPVTPLLQNAERVLRGGSWYSDATACNAAARLSNHPSDKNNGGFGFRIARISIR